MEILDIIKNLFHDLKEENIRYCHWKSNEHLEKALSGDTDLDILMDRKDYFKIMKVLAERNFKRFNIPKLREYIAVEDYLGFDYETGKIIHLHLHWQLTYGKKHIKENRFPWESLILEKRVYLEEYNTYIIDFSVEAIIFALRMAVKVRKRDYLLKRNNYLSHGAELEYLWLKERFDLENAKKYWNLFFDNANISPLSKFYLENPSYKDLKKLKKEVNNSIKTNQMFSSFNVLIYRWIREGFRIIDFLNKKTMKVLFFSRRKFSTGGIIVAFLGSDGSGKSTLIKEIEKKLSKNIDIKTVYLGSGDGKSSIMRSPLLIVYKILQNIGILNPKARSLSVTEKNKVEYKEKKVGMIFRKLGKIPWAITLSSERLSKIKKIIKLRNRGFFIVTDRYPQNQIIGSQDGPKLKKEVTSKNKILSLFARLEQRSYKIAEINQPDLLFRLQVKPEVATARKPKEVTAIKSKISTEIINSLKFEKSRIFDIDVNRDVDLIIKDILKIMWEQL